jgi:hypothetical protein
MENDRVLIGALIFLLLIVGSNLIMYGVVRGMTRGGGSNWVNTLRNSFNKPRESSSGKPMDELRKKIEEIEGKKKDET